MNKTLKQAMEIRRSHYAIDKSIKLSEEELQILVENAVKHTPSAFNSQSARAILLFGDAHDKLWDITMDALKRIVPESQFEATAQKIDSFKAGFGTVLFYEDQSIIEGLQAQFGLYKDNFPVWSEQSNGMLQYVIWTSFSSEGIGASLQHYNELISSEVAKTFDFSDKWKLIAQMPFGNPTAAPSEKQFSPIEDRVKVLR